MTDPKDTTEYLLGTIDSKLDTAIELLENHGDRIKVLETWKARAGGYFAGTAAVILVVAKVLHVV